MDNCARIDLIGTFMLSTSVGQSSLQHTSIRLLAFLSLQGSPVSRPELASALWPEHSERRSRGNLRAALWRLGPIADQVLDSREERVALRPETVTDMTEMRTRCTAALRADRIDRDLGESPKLLADLLPLVGDEWAEFPRERWRQLRLHVLSRYCEQLCDEAQPRHAVKLTTKALTGAGEHETLLATLDRAALMLADQPRDRPDARGHPLSCASSGTDEWRRGSPPRTSGTCAPAKETSS